MKTNAVLRSRALVLGILSLAILGFGVPLIVDAQDASPAASPAADPLITRGEEIFNRVCIACHQPDGKGIPGIYLPLAGNPAVTLDDPTYLITVLLNGRGGMPRFDTTYSDEDIAAIATFVRQEWGNTGTPVSPEQVAEVRATFAVSAEETPEGQVPQGSGRTSPEASPAATPGN